MILTRLLASVVALLGLHLLAVAVCVLVTAGRDGLVTTSALAAIGLAIGLPALSVALPRSRTRQ